MTKSDFATVTLPPAKCGGIVAVSQELAELSTPSAVGVMREEMIAGCAQFLDQQFVDPPIAAVANVSPASITNGASSTASAGTSQANAATDIQLLINRPGHVCVVASDRATYGQFAGCLAAIQATPGSSQYWEFSGGGGIAHARNLRRPCAEEFKGRDFWLMFQDDDNQFEPGILGSMLRRDRD